MDKQLGIILPNTNRALDVVLKEASPSDIKTILQDKDLKSIINSILKDSTQSSDSTLLNLAKNNPTLKDLGNISANVKELLNTLKSDTNPLPIEATLKKFLVDIKELNEPILKQNIENSGVFLESKLKNVQNPQVELKNLLLLLEKSIAKSDMPSAKILSINIKELLSSSILKEASNSSLSQAPKDDKALLSQLAKSVENIVSKLVEQHRATDIISTKDFDKQLAKIEHLISAKILNSENFKPALLSDAMQLLSNQVAQSSHLALSTKPEVKGLFDALFKIVESLKTIESSSPTLKAALESLLEKKIPQEIRTVVDTLKTTIEKIDPIFSKDTVALASKLTPLINPEKLVVHESIKDILSQDLKAVLLKTGDEIVKLSHPNQTEILKHVDKLLLQIDYFQLLSNLSNSSSLYLPFSWEQLEEGSIYIKKEKDDKFYCDIELKLKEYGELKIKLTLYEENQINIHLYSKNIEFREIVKENIASLRSALIESQITPREIRILDESKKASSSSYEDKDSQINIGFEVKV